MSLSTHCLYHCEYDFAIPLVLFSFRLVDSRNTQRAGIGTVAFLFVFVQLLCNLSRV